MIDRGSDKFITSLALTLALAACQAMAQELDQEYLVGIRTDRIANTVQAIEAAGGSVQECYEHAGSLLVRMTGQESARVAKIVGVTYVSPNQTVKGQSLDYGL